MRFRVLGWLEAADPAGETIDLGGAQPRLVVAMLLAATGQLVSADALVAALWGDSPPASAGGTLQSYVSRLRKVLEPARARHEAPQVLIHEPPGYRLAVGVEDVDFRRFERLADEGRALLGGDRVDDAATTLREALALWRGEPLPDYADHEFARGLITRLENRHRAALADRVIADLRLGRHAALVGELAEVVTQWPLEEAFRGQFALALYRSGRQAEALRAIDDARVTLRDELGVEMGRPLRELEHAILSHDPALDLVAAPGDGRATAPNRAPSPATAGSAPPRESSDVGRRGAEGFVGRDGELSTLVDALSEARTATRWAVAEGEPGIGKTRLAEEFAAIAEGAGARVLWGRAFEGGAAPAFWPWLPVLRALASTIPTASSSAELARVLDPASGEEPTSGSADAARFALFEATAQLVTDAAARTPLVIVLDDLQWADEASLELVRALVARCQDVPVLVVVTVRELDIGRLDAVADTLAAITRTTGSRRLHLTGLDDASCAELVAQTVGSRLDPTVVDAIERRAEGNPFFITELARLVASSGDVQVPAGVRDVVGRRIAALPAATRALLEQAAVLGRDAELDVLAEAVGRPIDDLLDDLEPALVHRLVEPSAGGLASFRFAHALVRDVVVGSLSSVRLARGHQRAAAALAALRPGDDHAEIVAEHLWAAVAIGAGKRAAEALERAAEVARRRLAFVSAEQALERAWQLRRAAGNGPEELTAELHTVARLVVLLAARRGYPGLVGSPVLQRAKWLAERTGNDIELLNLLYGEWAGIDVAGRMAESVTLMEQLVARAERSDHVIAGVVSHTAAGIVAWRRGRLRESAEHLDHACELTEQVTPGHQSGLLVDLEQLRLCVPFSMLVHDLMGDLDDPAAAATAAIAVQPDDPYWELLVLNFVAAGATVRGFIERAFTATRRADELDPERSAGFWSNAIRGYHGAALCMSGALDEGVAVVDEALLAYRVFGLRTAGGIWLSAKTKALAVAGRTDESRVALVEARREIADHGEHYTETLLVEAEAFLQRAEGAEVAEVERTMQRAWDLAIEQASFGSLERLRAAARELGVTIDERPVG